MAENARLECRRPDGIKLWRSTGARKIDTVAIESCRVCSQSLDLKDSVARFHGRFIDAYRFDNSETSFLIRFVGSGFETCFTVVL